VGLFSTSPNEATGGRAPIICAVKGCTIVLFERIGADKLIKSSEDGAPSGVNAER
jgi:hypothetical protein